MIDQVEWQREGLRGQWVRMMDGPSRDPGSDDLLRQAMRHHRSGALEAAVGVLDRLLAGVPEEPRALLLLALVQEGREELAAAAVSYERYLRRHPDDGFALQRLGHLQRRRGDHTAAGRFFVRAAAMQPDHAPVFNDLGVALYQMGDGEEALAAFDRAVALDPADLTTRCNRAKLLAALHRPEAAAAFRAVLDLVPRSAGDWHDRGTACLELGDLAGAEAACHHAMRCDPAVATGLEAGLLLAETLERSHRGGEARRVRSEVGQRLGVVTRRCLGEVAEARILLVGGAGLCNLPTDFLVDRRRFEVVTLLLPPDGEAGPEIREWLADLPTVDIAFNIVGDADAGAPFLDRVDSLLQSLACPVLNPPRRIPDTRRDRLAAVLEDVPDLVVPPMVRLGYQELVSETGQAGLNLPLLIRPVGSHGGGGLVRVETPQQLAEAIGAAPAESWYVSEYRDYRGPDGWFRKYRLVFVDGEVFPVHVAIGRDWLVHYWRTDMTDWMRREEAAFLADHRAVFTGHAAEAVQAVAKRLGLDFGGIDCALLSDGRVLLFEANATMLVHTAGAFPEKREQAGHVRDAMSRLILRRANSGDA